MPTMVQTMLTLAAPRVERFISFPLDSNSSAVPERFRGVGTARGVPRQGWGGVEG
jgi:hypothetical protein